MADATTQYIWDYLVNITHNEFGVAGLLGNIKAESGIIPYRLQGDFTTGYTRSIEYTEKVDNGTYSKNEFVSDNKGYGLAQWTFSSRKEKYYNWVKSSGGSIGSKENGVSYLVHELQTDFPSVWNTILTSTDIKTVSNKVLHDFENPEKQDESVENYRYNLSVAIYNEYSGGVVPSYYSHIIPVIIADDEN